MTFSSYRGEIGCLTELSDTSSWDQSRGLLWTHMYPRPCPTFSQDAHNLVARTGKEIYENKMSQWP